MSAGPVILMLAMTALMCGMVAVYERLLTRTRAERDELLDVLDGAVDVMRQQALDRHPAGTNVRVLRSVK